jgi:hypothetical protein
MRVYAAVLFTTACTHHHVMTSLRPISASAEASAQLEDGRVVEVHAAPTPEGARWMKQDKAARTSVIVESTDIRSYTTVSHGRGALEGLAVTGLSGAALGVVTGLASGDDKCNQDFCIFLFTAREKAVVGGVVFGGLGIVLGALIGAIVGSRDVYEAESAHVPRISTTIAPGRAGAGLSWTF